VLNYFSKIINISEFNRLFTRLFTFSSIFFNLHHNSFNIFSNKI